MNFSWISKPTSIENYIQDIPSESRALVRALLDDLITQTNTRPNPHFYWNGTKRGLAVGEAFITYKNLALFYGVSSNTIKKYIGVLQGWFGFQMEVLSKGRKGGVIIKWDNWSLIAEPWKHLPSKVMNPKPCTKGSSNVAPGTLADKDFQPVPEKAFEPTVQPSKSKNSNNKYISSLSSTKYDGNDQELIRRREGEKKIIDSYKSLIGGTVKSRELEKFREIYEIENHSVESILKNIKTIAQDPLTRALNWSINGIFYPEIRLDQLKEIKQIVASELNSLNKTFDLLSEDIFEGLVASAFNEAKRSCREHNHRVRFPFDLDGFKDYFAGPIERSRTKFQERQAELREYSNSSGRVLLDRTISQSCQELEVASSVTTKSKDKITGFKSEPQFQTGMTESDLESRPIDQSSIPDLDSQAMITRSSEKDRAGLALRAKAIEKCLNSSSQEADSRSFKEKESQGQKKETVIHRRFRSFLSFAKNEREMDLEIKKIADTHEIPEELSSVESIASFFSKEIEEVAQYANERALERYELKKKDYYTILKLGVRANMPVFEYPFPTYASKEGLDNTAFEEADERKENKAI